MSISFFFALSATTTLKGSSRIATQFEGPHRLFLNPGETFEKLKDFDTFKKEFHEMTPANLIENGCAELWVALRLQRVRYKMLKKSIIFILVAFGVLVIALAVAVLLR